MERPAGELIVRVASPGDIDEAVAINDDACEIFAQAGVHFDIGPEHPYARAERARWTEAARDGNALLAEAPGAGTVGILVMGRVGGLAYLEQLSVRRRAMRRGIGRHLLLRAIAWAGGDALWLTTYAHVPWNRPYYERAGFEVVPDAACPPAISALLDQERRHLPDPAQRVAMRRDADRANASLR
jgi:GNAT superfamily N-acetyltransferase